MPISDGVMKAAVNVKKNIIYFHVSHLFIYLFIDPNIYILKVVLLFFVWVFFFLN